MIFDVETDGLLDEATKIHCLSYRKGGVIKTTFDTEEMKRLLLSARVLIGHNIIRYDVPVLEKLLKIKIEARLIDTLGLSWYLYPSRFLHGLEDWGQHFGIPKPKIDDWSNLSPKEYKHRCEEDVKINTRLWNLQKDKLLKFYEREKADELIDHLSFKLDCAREQEKSGWKIDIPYIKNAIQELEQLQSDALDNLKAAMPKVPTIKKYVKPNKLFKLNGEPTVAALKWYEVLSDVGLPKTHEASVERCESLSDANPNSVPQVKDWLYSLGWVPQTFKFVKEEWGERKVEQIRVDNDGEKELCPSVLKLSEKEPAILDLSNLGVYQHRLGILRGFLNTSKNGRIKAEIAGFTNTLRFKHRAPAVNLPGINKPWGEAIRGALVTDEGKVLCGSDVVSLEENTKKHFMMPYDPDFVEEMSRPGFDAHLDLAKHAGAVTQDEIDKYLADVTEFKYVKNVRKAYKVANYACIYGVGKAKLARETGLSKDEAAKLIEDYWERNKAVRQVCDALEVKWVENEMWILNPVNNFYYSLRFEKDKFSTLNQGTGCYCFDMWVKNIREKRSQMTAQFHDEIVSCITPDLKDKYEKLLKTSMQKVNETLKLNINLDVDVQFGNRYSEIH